MATPIEEFQLEQYKALRTEIDQSITHARRVLLWSVLGSGAIWAYLLEEGSNDIGIAPIIGRWMPFVVSLMCLAYHESLVKQIHAIGKHIARMESEHFHLPTDKNSLGWETSRRNDKGELWESWPVVLWTRLIAAAVVAMNLGIAVMLACTHASGACCCGCH